MSHKKAVIISVSIAITIVIIVLIAAFLFHMIHSLNQVQAMATTPNILTEPYTAVISSSGTGTTEVNELNEANESNETTNTTPAAIQADLANGEEPIIINNLIYLQVNERRVLTASNNVDGYHYFRLHDLAHALGWTDMQFEPDDIRGQLTGLRINDSEYFSIREVSEVVGFRTSWVGSRNTIIIDTTVTMATEPVFVMEPLPQHVIELIRDISFSENAPFSYDHLTYLTITHVDFYGTSLIGNMIVAAEIGDEVLDIFMELYDNNFPIERIRLIDFYGGDDYLSMADNNSHSFNFRYIANTTTLSRHAFGMAIDINPIQNPYINASGEVLPLYGEEYIDRTHIRPGMIVSGNEAYNAFINRGWTWGGNWTSPQDYHHFERN